MRVLVVNAGSSSLKLSVLAADDVVDDTCELDRWDGGIDDERVVTFVAQHRDVDAVGHRVVHGGTAFRDAVVLDDEALGRIRDLCDLAPLHQPRAVAGIEAVSASLPNVRAVACFDTAFHTTMPAAASTYALPREWRDRWPLRRFGFHGLSHAYAARRVEALAGTPVRRLVTCHLGAGASLCAVLGGASVATTMGFTPLEGLVMATRSGTIDPGLVTWLAQPGRLTVAEVDDALSHRSGLAALAGSGDMRDVLEARAAGDQAAALAFDVYGFRLRQEIAAMVAALGGLDSMVFTGGVGEHAAPVRAAAADGLAFLGIALDEPLNARVTSDGEISARDAAVRTFVVTAREDVEIARQVRAKIG